MFKLCTIYCGTVCRTFPLLGNSLMTRSRCSYSSSSSSFKEEATDEDKKTHFGYENVSNKEKAEKVHGVFQNVAEKYDLMNDLMSGGIHRLWKDYFVHRLGPSPKCNYLDVAGGTGDIAFRIIQHINQQTSNNDRLQMNKETLEHERVEQTVPYQVTVCDISEGMLEVGERRSKQLGYSNIKWVCGDAQKLPFPDEHFDCYTIAFGMRNVVNIPKALSEAYRVLKPGGRFLCLEFSQVDNPAIRWFYDQYSFQVIPVIGQVVANDWMSYLYLVESIRKFPDQKEYKELIEDASFRRVRYENLTFGVTSIHSGFKI